MSNSTTSCFLSKTIILLFPAFIPVFHTQFILLNICHHHCIIHTNMLPPSILSPSNPGPIQHHHHLFKQSCPSSYHPDMQQNFMGNHTSLLYFQLNVKFFTQICIYSYLCSIVPVLYTAFSPSNNFPPMIYFHYFQQSHLIYPVIIMPFSSSQTQPTISFLLHYIFAYIFT